MKIAIESLRRLGVGSRGPRVELQRTITTPQFGSRPEHSGNIIKLNRLAPAMTRIDVSLRLALFVWGCLELLGYLWGGGIPKSADDLYLAMPAVALLLGAVFPNGLFRTSPGIGVFGLIALTGIVRSIHQAQIDLSLPNGGDLGAALLRLMTVLLLSLAIGRAVVLFRAVKTST